MGLPNKAYRPLWLSTLLDFAMGCEILGLLVPVFAWPQLDLILPGVALIVVGITLYWGLTSWEERTERKKVIAGGAQGAYWAAKSAGNGQPREGAIEAIALAFGFMMVGGWLWINAATTIAQLFGALGTFVAGALGFSGVLVWERRRRATGASTNTQLHPTPPAIDAGTDDPAA